MQLLLVLYFMNSIYIYEIPFGILINPFHFIISMILSIIVPHKDSSALLERLLMSIPSNDEFEV